MFYHPGAQEASMSDEYFITDICTVPFQSRFSELINNSHSLIMLLVPNISKNATIDGREIIWLKNVRPLRYSGVEKIPCIWTTNNYIFD